MILHYKYTEFAQQRPISFQKDKKNWVIGDIHGCYETFSILVEEQIQLTKSDTLYLLGDYIDRGQNSKGVIDYILALRQMGYDIVSLKGNHEDVMLRCYQAAKSASSGIGFYDLHDSWLHFGGKDTLASFEITHAKYLEPEYVQFLEELQNYQVLENFVLTHAGLNFALEDPFSDELAMMWIKNMPFDAAKIQYKRLVHGHVPTALETIRENIESENPVLCLDNGCVYQGYKGLGSLVALELGSMELKVQPNVELNNKKARKKWLNTSLTTEATY